MRRALFVLIITSLLIGIGPVSQAGVTTRVSVSSSGEQGNGSCFVPSISGDGRFVSFHSSSPNLVPGDTDGDYDIFVHDRLNGTTERVSISTSGEQANGGSAFSSISSDGRYVAFFSHASNLVTGDMNGVPDVFVRDRLTGTTERVSVSSSGEEGNNRSLYPSISADGRFVAFCSSASNLVSGDSNAVWDIFLRDRLTGTTERVSVSSEGVQANHVSSFQPSVSADGRYVAFRSRASNLVSNDTNGFDDVFVRDRLLKTTERVSMSSSGAQGNDHSYDPAPISADGRFVAFLSLASTLISGDANGSADVFVRDRLTGTTELISVASGGTIGNQHSGWPSMSPDARFVAFHSGASNLTDGDTNAASDAFVRDRLMGVTERVSISSSGEEGNGSSSECSISPDGRHVAFGSYASNLVSDDTNGQDDIFVRDRWGAATAVASIAEIRGLAPGAEVQLTGKIASTDTFSSPSMIYIQEPLRSAGILVLTPQTVSEGDEIRVTGRTGVWGCERAITEGTIEVLSTEGYPPKPLGVRNVALGGEASDIDGASGLYNIGLLIKTWGRVTQIGPDYIYIDDGSNLCDGTLTGSEPNVGVRVSCNPAAYEEGEYLLVTGVSSCFSVGENTHRMVRTRKVGDIVSLE